jgi:hypothetical protein
MTIDHAQPPSQHSTRDPWPEGFAVPAVAESLRAMASDVWEVRVGYSRAFEKRGRGNVGGTGNAHWVLRHFVGIQVQRPGGDRLINRAIYGADVDAEPLWWTVVSVQIDGVASNITSFRRLIKNGLIP